ncbi:MAG: serine/threonine-protein phosphatase [Actinomycetota bacterium]|nr:serine/threonine-protein phosphatase [Actinomycetota bacterium]
MLGRLDLATGNLALQPADRLVMVTNGMLERDAANLDLITEIGRTRAWHPRETTRRLTDMVLALSAGVLADDATPLVPDWHGGHGNSRHTSSGAEQLRASAGTRPPGLLPV